MKTLIALTFTIVGALLLAAPLLITFLLGMFSRAAMLNRDDRDMCHGGGVGLLLVGIVFSIFAFRANEKPSVKKSDDTKPAA